MSDISPRRVRAWHFLRDDGRLGYDDGRKAVVGETLSCDGKPDLCEHGMHGSARLIDALRYAPGPVLCRVEISGHVIEDDEKLVGRHRKCLWLRNVERELHLFACDVANEALQARIDAGENTDPRSHALIQAKRDWLDGKITDAELDAARAAARGAGWAAARDVARVARAAARAAAWDAAWNAARAAARDAQNERLTKIMHELGAPE